MKIDKKDLQILRILDWNARMPITQIAKKIKLNKDVVKYRISKLEEKGVIEGYYAVVNTSKLGYLMVRVYFDFIGMNIKNKKKVINYLSRKFDASQIFSIDGEYELGIIVWEKSIYNLSNKLNEFRNFFGKYILRENLSIITEIYHYPRKYFGGELKSLFLGGMQEEVFLKKNDILILSALSKNARITSTDLSVNLKIPQTTVVHRIKDLERMGILLGYRSKINVSKLGYENYFLEIFVNNQKEIEQINRFMKGYKNCVYSLSVLSGADFEVEVEFERKSELFVFINLLKEKFKSIEKIKYWSTIEYYKINYFPLV